MYRGIYIYTVILEQQAKNLIFYLFFLSLPPKFGERPGWGVDKVTNAKEKNDRSNLLLVG